MHSPGSSGNPPPADTPESSAAIVDYVIRRLFVLPAPPQGQGIVLGGTVDATDLAAKGPADSPWCTTSVWACGLRGPDGLSSQTVDRLDVLALRGPLSARALGLERRVPLGDATLLLPLVHDPRPAPPFEGCSVCVPAAADARSDAEILAASKAERLIRLPAAHDAAAVECFIDALVSARFTLCGALEAAMVAAAYQRPFSFWSIPGAQSSVPFSWEDFAASAGFEVRPQPDAARGEAHHAEQLARRIRLPALWPLLRSAPGGVRPEQLGRLVRWAAQQPELGLGSAGSNPTLQERLVAAEQQVQAANILLDQARLRTAANDALAAALEVRTQEYRRQLESAQQAAADARRDVEQLLQSSSWRFAAPYRALRDGTRPVLRALEGIKDLPSRLVTPPLMLPSYRAYKGDLHGFYRSWRRNGGFIDRMRDERAAVHERLQGKSERYRAFAARGFGIAMRIHECGGVLRTLDRMRRLLFRQGWAALGAWLDEVAPQPAPASPDAATSAGESGQAVARAPVAHCVLVADYRVPRADVSAGERATVGILRDLVALGFEVTLLPTDMTPAPQPEAELHALGVRVVTSDSAPEAHSASHFVELYGSGFGSFYLIRVDVAEALMETARRVAPHARILFHAPDLYFLRELRAAEHQTDLGARLRALEMRDRELAMMRRSDHVVLVSPAEVAVLQPYLPDTPISVFPVLYAPVDPSPAPLEERRNIFFLGGFGHPPNLSAVVWFVEQVWPRIRGVLPEVEFHIVGADAPPPVVALGELPGVRFVGYVADLDPLMQGMRVGVAPLLVGAGIKGKVAATMGAGVPCVCTRIAAEGMGIENGVHALVADQAGAFADAVVMLYTEAELWRRLARNGRRLVEARFSARANRATLLAVLDTARALPLSLYCRYWASAGATPVPTANDGTRIDVSIIVPVYNKWELTQACLASVIGTSHDCGVAYELIVADDGSTDATQGVASRFPGVRHLRTPENLGFLRNCNHAARQARGRHLLLLNNDTVVLPGWLSALYEAMESDPSIAIVGSKFLYPDGSIQEAGGGLRADASGVSVGRWVGPAGQLRPGQRDHPAFNFAREVDYLSGASILVRRTFWEQVHGFDERYQPAYCEDADLAMAARSNGWRVVYEPRSEVVHFEHQSYESDDSRHRRLMDAHGQVLKAKWAADFHRDHLPAGSPWYQVSAHADRHPGRTARERRRSGRLNVLYFSPFPSHPSNHGNQATIQQFAGHFKSLGHRVHFALLQSPMYSARDVADMRSAWDSLDILPNRHPLGSNGQVIAFDGWYEEGLGEAVAGLCGRYDIDLVFCSYVFQSKLLEFVPAHVLRVIDTHDKMGNRYDMLREKGQPLEFFSCTPEEEGRYLQRADVVVARRAAEAAYFDSVSGLPTSVVVPHFEAARFVNRTYGRLTRVGVVASANRINLALVEELLATLGRHLDAGGCPFVVDIAGQVRDMVGDLPRERASVFRQPWVSLRGFVADIGQFYAEVDVVVSPVTMGTGINVKTVQALAYGVPLLSTAWGTKGIPTQEPQHQHADMNALVVALLQLAQDPSPLPALARASQLCYGAFLRESLAGFDAMLRHPKLVAEAETGAPVAALAALTR